ncbi:MAG: response regulator [Candidatus Acidiferrum sp.]
MSLKIPVADEEPLSLKAMRSLTASLGHTVLAFSDFQEGGERAEKQRFDVAFLSMGTPEVNGLELARRIRNSVTNRDTAIVMLNTTDDIKSLRTAFGEGVDFVLTKPVSASRVRPMLDAMQSPGWKGKRHAARLPLFTEVSCEWGGQKFGLQSMNISESGILLRPSIDAEIGEEVSLRFKFEEFRADLNVRARIARKDGPERVGMEFVGLAAEDINAIQLYVMGHLNTMPLSQERTGSRSIWMGQGFLVDP